MTSENKYNKPESFANLSLPATPMVTFFITDKTL